MTLLLTSVFVPEEPNSMDVEIRFTAAVTNLVRFLGFIADEVQVALAKRIVLRRFEELHGRSNLSVWRLCQLRQQELVSLMSGSLTPYSPSKESPFTISGTVH